MVNHNFSPIAIICFNRPNHLIKTLNALMKNPEAANSEVYFFIDKFIDQKDKELNQITLEVCKRDWNFKKIHIIPNLHNKGLKLQIIDAATHMAKNHKNFILLEDDIVVSNKFLNYMNSSISLYEKSNIFHINGYNYNNFINNPSKAYISPLIFPWGWATWSDKWLSFVESQDFDKDKITNSTKKQKNRFNFYGLMNNYYQIDDNLSGKISTWFIFWYQHIILKDGFSLTPGKSHTLNIGFDGTGTNSGNKNGIKNIYNTKLNKKQTIIFPKKYQIFNLNLFVSGYFHIKKNLNDRVTYHSKKLTLKIKYHLIKIKTMIYSKYQSLYCRIFFNSKNTPLENIVRQNRKFYNELGDIISHEVFLKNNYGMQDRIFKKINLPMTNNIIYSDVIVYLLKSYFNSQANYFEIGVSALKNFLLVNNELEKSSLYSFDINEINPLHKETLLRKTKNNINYFKGSVLDPKAINKFKTTFSSKFDFIFSDALHTKEGLLNEYHNIYGDMLGNNFIIYFDDLDFPNLHDAALEIFSDLCSRMSNVNFYTFKVFGWIGDHEPLHLNGIITNIEIESNLVKDNLKLPSFKKVEI